MAPTAACSVAESMGLARGPGDGRLRGPIFHCRRTRISAMGPGGSTRPRRPSHGHLRRSKRPPRPSHGRPRRSKGPRRPSHGRLRRSKGSRRPSHGRLRRSKGPRRPSHGRLRRSKGPRRPSHGRPRLCEAVAAPEPRASTPFEGAAAPEPRAPTPVRSGRRPPRRTISTDPRRFSSLRRRIPNRARNVSLREAKTKGPSRPAHAAPDGSPSRRAGALEKGINHHV